MSWKQSPRWVSLISCSVITQLCVSTQVAAQDNEEAEETLQAWSIEEIHGPPLPFEITLEEGTWMSVDVSADGQTLVFDLLMVGYGGPTAEAYFYQMSDVYEDEKLLTFTPYTDVASRARRRQMAPMEDYHFITIAKTAAEILNEGGNVALGAHGNRQGLGAHWELWAMAMGGLSNMDALRTATTIPAESMGFDRDIGTLEPGKLADLLVLDANPLDDIRNTNTIRYVMKNGFLWNGDSMDQIWPEQKEFPGFHWEPYQARQGGR